MFFVIPLLRSAAQLIGNNPIAQHALCVISIVVSAVIEARWWQAYFNTGASATA